MRDYAHKQGLNDKRPPLKKHTRQETAPAWGWTILGIALGLGIAVLIAIKLFPKLVGIDRSLATPGELEQDDGAAAKIASLHLESAKITESKTPPKPKFDFYTLLPNMEETDIKEAKLIDEPQIVEPAPVAKPEQLAVLEKTIEPKTDLLPHHIKPETFILQAAVFQSKQPAESLKAQLTLQGFEVKIEAYQKNDSSTTWYRVYLGPYQQESQAKMAKASLQQTAHIDSFVIKTKV